jgi:hypothetical protein
LLVGACVHRDDGFPETLQRACVHYADCTFEMRKQVADKGYLCETGQLPADYCARLDHVVVQLRNADRAERRSEAAPTPARADPARADPARPTDEQAAWAAIDRQACAGGDPAACHEIARFRERYPRSAHDPEAHEAIAVGGEIIWRREHDPDAGLDDLAGRAHDDMARARNADTDRMLHDAHCCDGVALSVQCGARVHRECCSRHGGLCWPGQ